MPEHPITTANSFFVKTIGITTCLIALYDIIYFYLFITQIANRTLEHRSQHLFTTLLVTNAIVLPVSFVLLAIYLRHVVKNLQLNRNQKILWVLSFLFLPVFSMLVYWYKQLWAPHSAASISRKI